jgi:hypothetical protein
VASLSNNSLAGTIPVELGQLTELYELHLYDNELTGSVPTGLCERVLNSLELEIDCSVACDCGCPCRQEASV